MVDNIYQSIKGLFKSLLNLLLAVIDLVASLINGLAFILVRLRPHISQKYTELKGERGIHVKKRFSEFKGREEFLVEEIRNELKQEVTSREKYYYLSVSAANEGFGFYAAVISVLLFALLGVSMLFGIGDDEELRIAGIALMAVLCIAACAAIVMHQKKILKNKLLVQILEEEFADKNWEQDDEDTKQQPEQMAVIPSISVVGK